MSISPGHIDLVGPERAVVVTDAITTAAGLGPGRYTINRWEVVTGDDMVARAPDGSHLIGAAITMAESARHLREKLGYSEQAVGLMTRDNPQDVLSIMPQTV